MNSIETGRKAERAAKVYLEMRGYHILEQNYRRPHCEIDIIAEKDGLLLFVEVKYRKDDRQGGGLEAITASKLQHMRRAAQTWIEDSKWRGEHVLSAIEIEGPDFAVMNFIENVY